MRRDPFLTVDNVEATKGLPIPLDPKAQPVANVRIAEPGILNVSKDLTDIPKKGHVQPVPDLTPSLDVRQQNVPIPKLAGVVSTKRSSPPNRLKTVKRHLSIGRLGHGGKLTKSKSMHKLMAHGQKFTDVERESSKVEVVGPGIDIVSYLGGHVKSTSRL